MMGILKSQMIDALLKSIKGIAYILVATTYTSRERIFGDEGT